jgi:predicted AAA+ superfamily ATPase
MYYSRLSQISEIIKLKSCFLLGPRQTGKSTLLKTALAEAPVWNLLDVSVFLNVSADPSIIRRQIRAMKPKPSVVVIDEIQKLPLLLNEVHLMIEEDKIRFVLTGSSARALRRQGVNLLAGRARMSYLHPFVSRELGSDFDLLRALNRGLIPSIYLSDAFDSDLADYAGTFLKEEIMNEGLSRNIPAFSRFLEVAALSNGTVINFTNLASDTQAKRTTVVDWYDVLKDTLIAHELPAWNKSIKRKAIQAGKYYLFDTGVARHLAKAPLITERSKAFGDAFEHFLFLELKAAQSYAYLQDLHYWRSTSGFEVDFLVNNSIAIEAKGKINLDSKDFKGLKAIGDEPGIRRRILVCMREKKEVHSGIEVMPWQEFLELLWNKNLDE